MNTSSHRVTGTVTQHTCTHNLKVRLGQSLEELIQQWNDFEKVPFGRGVPQKGEVASEVHQRYLCQY